MADPRRGEAGLAHPRPLIRISVAVLFVLALARPELLADIVRLRSGGVLEGKILEETDAAVRVRLRTGGEVTIPRSDILSVEYRETPEEEFARRRSALEAQGEGAEAWAELARWAEGHGLDREVLDAWREAARREGAEGPARGAFERCLRRRAQGLRARADRVRDDPEAYRSALEDLAREVPESEEGGAAMLELARMSPREEDAKSWLRRAIEARPGWAAPWEEWERRAARRGDWVELVSLLEESRRDPRRLERAREGLAIVRMADPPVERLERLAEICRSFEAPQQAARWEERIVAKDPSRRDAALRAAETWAAAADWRRAFALLHGGDLRRMEYRARYEGVLEAPDPDVLAPLEALVEEYWTAEAGRRREIAAVLRGVPRNVVEAVVRRGRRYDAPGLTGGPLRFRAHVDAGDYDVEYLVYVPAAYHPAVPAPALISLHGATGSGDNHIHFWLERFRRRDDVFLIAPTAARYGWGRARQGHAAVLAVRRDVLQRWNIDPSRLYLDGASMGGNGSYEIASLYPGRFAAIAPRIGAPLRLRTVDPRTREERVEVRFVENLCATPVFTVVGARDDRIPIEQVRLGRDRMREVGVPLVYHEHADGGHEWFPEEDEAVLEWMLRQRLLRYPNPLWFVTDEEAFPRGYWIEVLEPAGREQIEFQHLDRNNEVAEVRRAYRPDARIRAQVDRDANEIRLNAQGVRRLRLYLHDALVDFEREIVVRANRTVVFRGRVEPSVEFLLEEARRTGEREIVYWGSVDVDVRR